MGATVVAAGAFLYGGRHSSPQCRGDEEDRFLSGRCPVGTSSRAHSCTMVVPLCPITEAVRQSWAVGEAAPPRVEVLFDSSTCSVLPLEEVATTTTTAPANATVPGVTGESGLADCVRRVLAAGGCADHTNASRFAYDDASGDCGCCASDQVAALPDGNYSAAVYGLGPAPTNTAAPTHCISGSTLFYPATADGGGHTDATHACACGSCATCGGSATRYLDWSGPFVVGSAIATTTFADEAKTAPLYDPVDTCLCDYVSVPEICPGSAAAARGAGGPWGGVVAAMALVLAARRW